MFKIVGHFLVNRKRCMLPVALWAICHFKHSHTCRLIKIHDFSGAIQIDMMNCMITYGFWVSQRKRYQLDSMKKKIMEKVWISSRNSYVIHMYWHAYFINLSFIHVQNSHWNEWHRHKSLANLKQTLHPFTAMKKTIFYLFRFFFVMQMLNASNQERKEKKLREKKIIRGTIKMETLSPSNRRVLHTNSCSLKVAHTIWCAR